MGTTALGSVPRMLASPGTTKAPHFENTTHRLPQPSPGSNGHRAVRQKKERSLRTLNGCVWSSSFGSPLSSQPRCLYTAFWKGFHLGRFGLAPNATPRRILPLTQTQQPQVLFIESTTTPSTAPRWERDPHKGHHKDSHMGS